MRTLGNPRLADRAAAADVPAGLAAVRQELDRCIHCGVCLQACPTYEVRLTEDASPRGRIQLLAAVARGQLSLGDGVVTSFSQCLGCRACETACPVGVRYGEIFAAGRRASWEGRTRQNVAGRLRTAAQRILLNGLIPRPRLLKGARTLLWLGQRTGILRALVRPRLPAGALGTALALAGSLPQIPSLLPPRPPRRARTGAPPLFLFLGCVQEALYPETNRATAALLAEAGFGVASPPAQVCCGALHEHLGDGETARRLARRNIEAFAAHWQRHPETLVAVNAGGCGTMLKEYAHLFAEGDPWHARAAAFARRVRDVSELLAGRAEPQGRAATATAAASRRSARPLRVSYQDSCHLRHGQGIWREPRQLLQSLPGVEYVELPGADRCCGSAGVYNLVHPDWSSEILAAKMRAVAHVLPDVLVTSNPGCFFQLCLGVARAGLAGRVRVVPLPDFLRERRSGHGPAPWAPVRGS